MRQAREATLEGHPTTRRSKARSRRVAWLDRTCGPLPAPLTGGEEQSKDGRYARVRTGDLRGMSPTLYQLSYAAKGVVHPRCCAGCTCSTTELPPHGKAEDGIRTRDPELRRLVGTSEWVDKWLGREDSNLQPPGSEPGASAIELRPNRKRSCLRWNRTTRSAARTEETPQPPPPDRDDVAGVEPAPPPGAKPNRTATAPRQTRWSGWWDFNPRFLGSEPSDLGQTSLHPVVGMAGFEPTTFWSRTRRATNCATSR